MPDSLPLHEMAGELCCLTFSYPWPPVCPECVKRYYDGTIKGDFLPYQPGYLTDFFPCFLLYSRYSRNKGNEKAAYKVNLELHAV